MVKVNKKKDDEQTLLLYDPSPHSYTIIPITDIFLFSIFFFNDTATTEIYTLSLHDALPIIKAAGCCSTPACTVRRGSTRWAASGRSGRSEEHTSELQSQFQLVCRLLLE